MASDELARISQILDKVFAGSVNQSFDELSHQFDAARTSLLNNVEPDIAVALEVERGIQERLIVGAIKRSLPPETCLAMFNDVDESLGFQNAVRKWSLASVVAEYLQSIDKDRYAEVVAAMTDEAIDELKTLQEGCRNCLEQASALRASNDSG